MKIGKRIRKARKGKGWTMDVLAERVALSRSAVQVIETDQRSAPAEVLIRISRELKEPSLLVSYCAACQVRQELIAQEEPKISAVRGELGELLGHVAAARRCLEALSLDVGGFSSGESSPIVGTLSGRVME